MKKILTKEESRDILTNYLKENKVNHLESDISIGATIISSFNEINTIEDIQRLSDYKLLEVEIKEFFLNYEDLSLFIVRCISLTEFKRISKLVFEDNKIKPSVQKIKKIKDSIDSYFKSEL